jgi:hypothetical protein
LVLCWSYQRRTRSRPFCMIEVPRYIRNHEAVVSCLFAACLGHLSPVTSVADTARVFRLFCPFSQPWSEQ